MGYHLFFIEIFKGLYLSDSLEYIYMRNFLSLSLSRSLSRIYIYIYMNIIFQTDRFATSTVEFTYFFLIAYHLHCFKNMFNFIEETLRN